MHIIIDQQVYSGKVTTLEVSSLPRDCSGEDLQSFCEHQGGDVSVHSKTMLGGGKARLELYGLTTDGMPPS